MNILVSACLLGVPCRYDGKSRPCAALLALRSRCRLIPVCPETAGGLPTPRTPCERCADRVLDRNGRNRTAAYQKGAASALKVARRFGCTAAVLKSKSPSCGCDGIYDGSFSGTLTDGVGVTAQLLLQNKISVYSEEQLALLEARHGI